MAIVSSFIYTKILTIAHWSGILVLVNQLEKLRKPKSVA